MKGSLINEHYKINNVFLHKIWIFSHYSFLFGCKLNKRWLLQEIRIRKLILWPLFTLTNCITMSKVINLSEPQFPLLWKLGNWMKLFLRILPSPKFYNHVENTIQTIRNWKKILCNSTNYERKLLCSIHNFYARATGL